MPTRRNINKCENIEKETNERQAIKKANKEVKKQTQKQKRQTTEADYTTSKRRYVQFQFKAIKRVL